MILSRLFNLLFILIGNLTFSVLAATLTVSSLLFVCIDDQSLIIPFTCFYISLVTLFLFLTITFGMCAIIKRSKIFFIINLVLLSILTLCSIGLFITSLVKSDKDIKETATTNFILLANRGYSSNAIFKLLVDGYQTKYSCCGVNGPDDWDVTPSSCCREQENCMDAKAYEIPCFANDKSLKAPIVGITISISLLFASQFACVIFYMKSIKCK